MKKNLFRFSSAFVAALAVAACTDDPTEAFRAGATSVATSLSYVEIVIADSVVLTAQTRDAQGNALSALPEITAANTAVAIANTDTVISGKPAPETQFSIVALGFGTTTVTATSGGLSTDITVQTWPASIGLAGTGLGGQVSSGGTVTITPTALGSDGMAFAAGAGDIVYQWSSSGAQAAVDAMGVASAQAPGLAVISVSALRASDSVATGATGQASFEVVPGPFDGTVPAGAQAPMSVVRLTAGTAAFDSDTKVLRDGFPADFITIDPAGAFIDVIVEDWGAGTLDFLLTDVGPNQLAFAFQMDVGAYARPTDPTAAPNITAGPFPLTLYAAVSDNDPDAFFELLPAVPTAYTVTADWMKTAADVDILWYDNIGRCCWHNFSAATGSNPEVTSATVDPDADPGTAPNINNGVVNVNMYDAHGAGLTTVRLVVTSP